MVLFKLAFQVQPGTCCMGLTSSAAVGSVPWGTNCGLCNVVVAVKPSSKSSYY